MENPTAKDISDIPMTGDEQDALARISLSFTMNFFNLSALWVSPRRNTLLRCVHPHHSLKKMKKRKKAVELQNSLPEV